MKIEKSLIREVLEKLYDDYFPDSCLTPELCKVLSMEKEPKSVLAVVAYLKEKELIIESEDMSHHRTWKINVSGIELLEGDLLAADPSFFTVHYREEY